MWKIINRYYTELPKEGLRKGERNVVKLDMDAGMGRNG